MSFDSYELILQDEERRDINPKFRTAYLQILEKHLVNDGIIAFFGMKVNDNEFPLLRVQTPFGFILLFNNYIPERAPALKFHRGYFRWWVPDNLPYPNTFRTQGIARNQFVDLPQRTLEFSILKLIALIEGLDVFRTELIHLSDTKNRFAGYAVRVYNNTAHPSLIFTLGFSKLQEGTNFNLVKYSDYKIPPISFKSTEEYIYYLFRPTPEEVILPVGTEIVVPQQARYQVSSCTFRVAGNVIKTGLPAIVLEDQALLDHSGLPKRFVLRYDDFMLITHGTETHKPLIDKFTSSSSIHLENFPIGSRAFPKRSLQRISSPIFTVRDVGRDMFGNIVVVLYDPFSFILSDGKLIHKNWYVYEGYVMNNFKPDTV